MYITQYQIETSYDQNDKERISFLNTKDNVLLSDLIRDFTFLFWKLG